VFCRLENFKNVPTFAKEMKEEREADELIEAASVYSYDHDLEENEEEAVEKNTLSKILTPNQINLSALYLQLSQF
jgi:hypothetical protein